MPYFKRAKLTGKQMLGSRRNHTPGAVYGHYAALWNKAGVGDHTWNAIPCKGMVTSPHNQRVKNFHLVWFRNLLIHGFATLTESKRRKLSHGPYVVLSKTIFYDNDTVLYTRCPV